VSQKVYIESEDLTIVITGFTTSRWKSWVYTAICVLTLGLGWLVFRWFPRWRVALTANQARLADCEWVIVEVCICGAPFWIFIGD
jgi:cation-transporting ATPase 13A2